MLVLSAAFLLLSILASQFDSVTQICLFLTGFGCFILGLIDKELD